MLSSDSPLGTIVDARDLWQPGSVFVVIYMGRGREEAVLVAGPPPGTADPLPPVLDKVNAAHELGVQRIVAVLDAAGHRAIWLGERYGGRLVHLAELRMLS
jgi:hypothetical protein